MPIKEKLKLILQEIRECENKSQELDSKAFDLRQEQNTLILEYILSEKMFDGTSWHVRPMPLGTIILELDGGMTSLFGLSNLLGDNIDLYSQMNFSDDICFTLDGAYISLSFNSPGLVLPFVRQHQLIIIGAQIYQNISALKKQVAALETLCHHLGI